MEVQYALWLVKKWFWLIILAILIGGAVALGVNNLQPKVYAASATLYVSSLNRNDYQTVLGAQQVAKAFTLFPQSDGVLQATLNAVGDSNLSLPQLSSMVSAQNSLNAQFVVISVSNSDPRLAAQLASEIAKQSIAQFMASQASNVLNQQFIQQQMASLQTEIHNLQEQITQAQLGTPTPAKTALVNQLNTQLSSKQLIYNQLLSSEANINGFQVTIVEQPEIPKNPVGLGKALAVAIGALAGLVVIVCVILFMEQTKGIIVIRPGDQISVLDEETGLPMLITIKDPRTRETTEQAETKKLGRIVLPKQIGTSVVPETPKEGAALESHDSWRRENLRTRETLEQIATRKVHRIVLPKHMGTSMVPETPKEGAALEGLDPTDQERGVNGLLE